MAVETNPKLATVPVRLAPDEATARLWALAENTARAGLHIADEVRAYRRMAETGTPLPAIASAFAVTEAHVRRRLKLASLPEPILDALKAGRSARATPRRSPSARTRPGNSPCCPRSCSGA